MGGSGMIKAAVTASTGTGYAFPEKTPAFLAATSNCAICFSGGGTRALSAAMGQMRGLHQLGVLENARYISCVSGGSWASSVYTYYRSGAHNDDELLGTGPASNQRGSWGLKAWSESLVPANLAHSATTDFRDVVLPLMAKKPADMAWIHAVRDVYFKPFGLHEARYFSLDEATVKSIVELNAPLQPEWTADDFIVTRPNRPYLVVNGTLMWPVKIPHPVNRVLVQFTPLYVGNPYALQLKEGHLLEAAELQNTGGGVIDTYAFGSTGPNAVPGNGLTMPAPVSPFAIWHASGISSAAFGYIFASDHLGPLEHYIPRSPYWAVTGSATSQSACAEHYFTDGGNLENNGLMAMLQRQVEKVVVFVNSERPISKNKHGEIIIDSDMAPLFGLKNKAFPNNTVFDSSQYQPLLDGLWATNKNRGNLAMFKTRYTTVNNDWYGIKPYDVDILWVYNSPVDNWLKTLAPEVQASVKEGIAGTGPLAHFPNYKTIGDTWFHLVELSPEKVALIADMFSWSIGENSQMFTDMLQPVKGRP